MSDNTKIIHYLVKHARALVVEPDAEESEAIQRAWQVLTDMQKIWVLNQACPKLKECALDVFELVEELTKPHEEIARLEKALERVNKKGTTEININGNEQPFYIKTGNNNAYPINKMAIKEGQVVIRTTAPQQAAIPQKGTAAYNRYVEMKSAITGLPKGEKLRDQAISKAKELGYTDLLK